MMGLLALTIVLLFIVPTVSVIRGLHSEGMPSQLLGWLALLSWLVACCRRDGRLAIGPQPVRWFMAIFLVIAAWSYGIAWSRPLLSLEEGNALRQGYLVAAGAGLALLLADGIPNMSRLRRMNFLLLAGGYFSAVVGLLQKVAHWDYSLHATALPFLTFNAESFGVSQFNTDIGRGFRAYGTATHAIEFAVVCSTLLPLALHACLHAPTSRLRRFHGIGAALLAMGAFISISRSGVVGIVVGLLIYMWTLPRASQLNVLGAGFGVLVLVEVAAPKTLSTLRYLLLAGNNDPSYQHRALDIPYIIPLLQHHVWAGIGYGTYQPQVYRYLDNEFLKTLVQSGVIGMLGLGLFFLTGATLARSARRHAQSAELRDFGQALAAGIWVLGVSAYFYDELSFRQSTLVLFILIGFAGAAWRLALSEDRQPGSRDASSRSQRSAVPARIR